jgi:hypothetical protein
MKIAPPMSVDFPHGAWFLTRSIALSSEFSKDLSIEFG